MADDEVRVRVVQLLARKRVVGAHMKRVDTVKSWFPTHEQGHVEELIREMIRDPDAPFEGYGGDRDNVRLTSIEAAKQCIVDRSGELPWGLRDE